MAKIITRPSEETQEESKAFEQLLELLSVTTSGVVSNEPTAQLKAGDTLEELINTTRILFEAQERAGHQLLTDMAFLSHENLLLSVKLTEAIEIIESFLSIEYDEALDHATADLMDELCSSGAAEADHDGDLSFDQRITLSKNDLKPMLRAALQRWVELKVA